MKKAEKQFQKARKKVPGNKILNNCLARYIKPDNKVKGVSYLGRVEAETNHNILFVILHQIIQKTLRINEKNKNLLKYFLVGHLKTTLKTQNFNKSFSMPFLLVQYSLRIYQIQSSLKKN